MNRASIWKTAICGLCAGAVTGLFGAGGGMVLIPLLSRLTDLEEKEMFPSSVCIILPICLVTLARYAFQAPLPLSLAMPYLAGSVLGGIGAGLLAERIPVLWLHRVLGALILWGGFRYIWN